jgi:hypothetical protein
MRDLILNEIRRLARLNSERPPGATVFARETGIAEHQWRGKFWARWGDALVEAGYQPNQWTERLASSGMLKSLVTVCRHYGRVPTNAEISMYRKLDSSTPPPQTIRSHFKNRAGMIVALAKFVDENEGYDDIKTMLPSELPSSVEPPASTSQLKTAEGFVYLIQSGDFYKIGRSDDIERRFKEIRTAMPDKATLVHTIRTDDPVGIEAYWHRRFAEKRANGEWFKLTSLDISAFKKRKYQ